MKNPTIICDICKKPVERLEWWDDKINDVRVIRVHCHGDRDEMRLRFSDMIAWGSGGLPDHGVAFSTKRLEKPCN